MTETEANISHPALELLELGLDFGLYSTNVTEFIENWGKRMAFFVQVAREMFYFCTSDTFYFLTVK